MTGVFTPMFTPMCVRSGFGTGQDIVRNPELTARSAG
ncbi:hypothetical protein BJ917_1417 [Pseudomonas sp. WPR_5_2]|nr:hypothetical protein BJ917_1417 [Pseudomonas sp. WPR_5_2]